MRALNLDHLRALTEVVELESFTRAAKKLNLAQPTISLQIRELETRLGVQLVERLGKKAYATAAGKELIIHAKRIADESERALAAMRRFRDGWIGRVRIGASTNALVYHLPPVLQRLRVEHPNVELLVMTGTTTTTMERLVRNEVDLGIVSLPIDERSFEVIPLFDEPLVAIFPERTPALPDVVTARYMHSHTLIIEYARAHVKMMIMDWLAADGGEMRPAMELDNLQAVKRMVAAGLGASIVPQAAMQHRQAPEGLVVRPLEPPIVRRLALTRRKDKDLDEALIHVRDALLSLAQLPRDAVHASNQRSESTPTG